MKFSKLSCLVQNLRYIFVNYCILLVFVFHWCFIVLTAIIVDWQLLWDKCTFHIAGLE